MSLPTVGSRWYRRVGSTSEGPWFVREVSHVVKLYLPNELSPCGEFAFVPVENWPAGFIGVAT